MGLWQHELDSFGLTRLPFGKRDWRCDFACWGARTPETYLKYVYDYEIGRVTAISGRWLYFCLTPPSCLHYTSQSTCIHSLGYKTEILCSNLVDKYRSQHAPEPPALCRELPCASMHVESAKSPDGAVFSCLDTLLGQNAPAKLWTFGKGAAPYFNST